MAQSNRNSRAWNGSGDGKSHNIHRVGWPKEAGRAAFDMMKDDVEPFKDYTYKPVRKQAIKCRLEIKKYPYKAQAEKRCKEIHGTTFEGVFQSGRFWVFWEWEARKCISW